MKPLALIALLLTATAVLAQQGDALARRTERAQQPLTAQELSHKPEKVLNRIAQSLGRYARDISEVPLNVETTVTKFDAKGHEKSRKTSSHSMRYVKRSYGGEKITRRLEAQKGMLHRVSVDELNADSATALLALLFDNGKVADGLSYALTLHALSNRLELKTVDTRQCEGFDPGVAHGPRPFCGETHLLLDSTTLEPLSAAFEQGGFPKTFGDIRYLSFKFTEEFQKVVVAGNDEPFLLPAKLVVTYDTDRGKTVIESKYAVAAKTLTSAAKPAS